MIAKTMSFGLSGLEPYPLTIEVDCSRGLPALIIVGLPDNAVKESRERVRSAIINSGYRFQSKRVTVNLSPADVKKEGPSFDLPIALGVLAASGQINPTKLQQYVFLGELSLDGHILPVQGVFPIAMSISPQGIAGLIVPKDNAWQAAFSAHLPAFPARTLTEVIHFLEDPTSIEPFQQRHPHPAAAVQQPDLNFADVKGQYAVKRGLEIAAAGSHNCLLIGPPGSGKTMLAKRLPSILPEMSYEESVETTKIHSIMGLVPSQVGLLTRRPFRNPHHTCSDVALVGGGSTPKPGEVTLAHNGVLYLDELPEFNRHVLEALRQPLEDRQVTISRASRTLSFPAHFMLITSMNPCPCGFLTDPRKQCRCTPPQIQRYLARVSGPLLDRIDLHLEVPPLKTDEMRSAAPGESSRVVLDRITRTRAVQARRLKSYGILTNSQMPAQLVRRFCPLSPEAERLLTTAIDQLGLSARAHDRVLKVARTIADLEESNNLTATHMAEAIQYRNLDRNYWS